MDHESARACFTGYHDGELADGERRALEEHLSGCAECNAEWETYRRAVEEVSGLKSLSPSEDFARQVALAIELRRSRRKVGGLSLTGLRVAILSLVLLLLFVLVYLTYLFLFAEPQKPEPPVDPATRHQRGDVEVIGPIHMEPPPEPAPKAEARP
jgi:predicted anti-sigma-YlaC factor YlaD